MDPIGILHTILAVVALVVGGMIFRIPKGSKRHRVLGYVYVFAMLAVNISALMIYKVFKSFGPFHVLAIISLAALFAGWWPAYRRKPRETWLQKHYEGMCWSYIGLLAATVAEIVVRLPFVKGFGWAFGLSTLIASFIVVFIGAYFLHRYRDETLAPFRPPVKTPETGMADDK